MRQAAFTMRADALWHFVTYESNDGNPISLPQHSTKYERVMQSVSYADGWAALIFRTAPAKAARG